MQDSLGNWRHEAPTVFTFWSFFVFVWTAFVRMSFTTHNTFLFFSTILCLVPKTLASETLLDRGCYSKFLDLENYACFLAYYFSPPPPPPEISASSCFWSSHFIFIKGKSSPVLFDFIVSALAWVIVLKSSRSLKIL